MSKTRTATRALAPWGKRWVSLVATLVLLLALAVPALALSIPPLALQSEQRGTAAVLPVWNRAGSERVWSDLLPDFARTDALRLEPGERYLYAAAIDPAAGYAYYGTDTDPGQVVRVRLSDFTRAGVLTLDPGESYLSAAVIDPAGGYAYFGTNTGPGKVVRVRLSDFTHAGTIVLTGTAGLYCAAIDAAGGYAYFGAEIAPGRIARVDLATFSHAGTLILPAGDNYLISAVIDPAGGYAYFGTLTTPGRVVRIHLPSFTHMDTLNLSYSEGNLRSAVIDPAGNYAYFGNQSSPSIARVRLSDFSYAGGLGVGGSYGLLSAVIDPAGGYAYFGTGALPGRIVRVDLADFTYAGALTLAPGENGLTVASIDPAAHYAYWGTYTSPGIVVRVDLAAPDLAIEQAVAPATVLPGAAITYTLALSNLGGLAHGVVVTDSLPPEFALRIVSSSLAITSQSGVAPFVWQVQDMAPGSRGVITVAGALTGCVPAGTVLTGTAAIATSGDITPTNNQSAPVTVTVRNVAPQAGPDFYTTTENTTLTVAAPGVLENDHDANCDPLVAVVDSPPWTGTLALSVSGAFTYVPALDSYGIFTFTYHSDDGIAPSNITLVTISVVTVCHPVTATLFTWAPPVPMAGQVVTFSASTGGTAPFSFTWDWGDGSGGSGAVVTHTFAAGTFSVTLTAENGCGSATVTQTVVVEPKPDLYRVYLPVASRQE